MTDHAPAAAGIRKILPGDDWPLDPAVEIFPAMSADQREALKADIREHGVRVPVVLFNGAVADGRHRYELARDLGLPCPATEFCGTRDELIRQLLTLNFHRRHLTPSQRAAVAAMVADKLGLASEALGRLAGVSGRYVRLAQRLNDVSPEHIARVAGGESTLPEAIRDATPPGKADAPADDDAAEPEIGDQRDCLGHLVPADLIPVFSELDLFAQAEKHLAAAKRAIKKICSTRAGVRVDKPAIMADVKNAVKELKAKKPYCLCPLCSGDGCRDCEHCGWVSESLFALLPADVRERWTSSGQASLADGN